MELFGIHPRTENSAFSCSAIKHTFLNSYFVGKQSWKDPFLIKVDKRTRFELDSAYNPVEIE